MVEIVRLDSSMVWCLMLSEFIGITRTMGLSTSKVNHHKNSLNTYG